MLSECSTACIICKIWCHCSISSCTDNRISQCILNTKHIESFGRFSLWINWVENVFHCSYRWSATQGRNLEKKDLNLFVFATSLSFPKLNSDEIVQKVREGKENYSHFLFYFLITLHLFAVFPNNLQWVSYDQNINMEKIVQPLRISVGEDKIWRKFSKAPCKEHGNVANQMLNFKQLKGEIR